MDNFVYIWGEGTKIKKTMRFNRQIWLKWETRKPCPICEIGLLIPNTDEKLLKETEYSKKKNSDGEWHDSDYIFSIHLTCSECSETVAVSGYMSEENYPINEEIGLQKCITPVVFYPAPKIIETPKSCPNSVTKILNNSFGLYWLDLGSCANKIRIAIEVLMDEQQIPKTSTNGKKEFTLHQRLEKFEMEKPEVSKYLMAIKWIGNAGSHFFDITNEDVLDAYELLEFSLDKLYNDREQKMLKLSNDINKAKKPIKNNGLNLPSQLTSF